MSRWRRERRARAWRKATIITCGPLGEKQLPAAQRGALIDAALRGEVELKPIKRERRNLLTNELLSREKSASGYAVTVPLSAVVDERRVRWKERRLVVRSLAYTKAEAAPLDKRVARAETELRRLVARKQGKRRLDAEQSRVAAGQISARGRVAGLLSAAISTTEMACERRRYKDRPAGPQIERQVSIKIKRDCGAIRTVKEHLGWRSYATNHPQLSLSQAVLACREQYRMEDGISRLKGRPLGLSPMFLQTESRMTGLINLLIVALRVLTLIEFQVRRGLRAESKTLSGIYAGQKGRQTTRPSAELLLKAFQGIEAVVGTVKGESLSHLSPLTVTQQRVLTLLGLDTQLYDDLLSQFQKSRKKRPNRK